MALRPQDEIDTESEVARLRYIVRLKLLNSMTFGTFYLLFLAICTVFFSVKSEAIKNRFLINFADRIDNTALASSYLITTLAFIALGTLIMQEVF